MKRLARTLLPLGILLLAVSTPSTARSTPQEGMSKMRVVVHAENPIPQLGTKEIAHIFYKKAVRWPGWVREGENVGIVPVDRETDAPIRDLFSRGIFGKSAAAIEFYWQRQVFSGASVPPAELSSDEEVLDFVRRNPGAIGYVSAAASLGRGVRSLSISDAPAFDDSSWVSDRAGEEVVAERGEVRILLTGSCDLGEGRTAILQHRDGYGTVRVAVETSRWRDGALEESHRRTHTLAGHEEIRLGCTRSGSAELRYALVSSSDNSARTNPVYEERAPSRNFIVLTESGTCGRGGAGRVVSVLNRHSERSILVFIETVRRIDGRMKNRVVRSHRLEPGGEKELGCNRDGTLVTEYAVLDTN